MQDPVLTSKRNITPGVWPILVNSYSRGELLSGIAECEIGYLSSWTSW
jgi:hypothetical protein